MPIHLLTICETRRGKGGVQLFPGIRISQYSGQVKSMRQGCPLELREPNGRVIQSTLLSFGVLIEKNSAGEIAYRGNPADAEIILTLPPDIRDNDISTGTEVWLI